MDLVTLDFETFYSREFSLSKLTTEEYIRDDRFEVIGVCAKHNDGPVEWVTGDRWEIQRYLDNLELQDKAVLAHNMMFDGAILSWRFGIHPKLLLDTLSMSRAWHGVDQRHSLAALAKQYGLPDKGTEVQNAMGLRRADFSDEQLAAYGEYCKHDVDLCLSIFNSMIAAGFPKRELQLIDKTLRMFTEPRLDLDLELLEGHLIATQRRKQKLLDAAGVADKKDLMSNAKFADLLEKLGVDPPMKVSPTTGKLTYAFAKTDPAMKELEEHENPHVQTLVAARLGNKSTLEETRTERFMAIAGRGKLPIPLRYYAAHTGRWGGCLVDDTAITVFDKTRGVCEKKIVDVLADDLVWDGVEFVSHEGVVFSGYAEVIEWDGVRGTEDHVVFTDAGEISLREAKEGGHNIQTANRPDKHAVDSARHRAGEHKE